MSDSPKKRPVVVPERVAEIGRGATIRSLNLVRSDCAVLDFRDGDVIENLKIQLTGGGRKDTQRPRILCSFGLLVEPQARGRADAPVARIHCEYAVQYEFADQAFFQSISERDIELFAALNTSLNVWPHAREFVQSMAGRMMLPPVVLPLFRPTDMLSPENWQKLVGA